MYVKFYSFNNMFHGYELFTVLSPPFLKLTPFLDECRVSPLFNHQIECTHLPSSLLALPAVRQVYAKEGFATKHIIHVLPGLVSGFGRHASFYNPFLDP